MEALYILIGFVVLIIIFVAITYNGLVAKRNMVRNSFSSIDVNLKKRTDLIPNLVKTVKAVAAHEKGVLTEVTELRSRIQEAASTGERLQLESQMSPMIGKVFALSENYPELKANENFLHLQRTLNEVEEQLSAARRAYNAAVLDNNNAIESFPSNIIANNFGFKVEIFFEIAEAERAVPETF